MREKWTPCELGCTNPKFFSPKIRGNRILTSERFEAAVRPDASMQAEAIKVHRLREVDVAQAL